MTVVHLDRQYPSVAVHRRGVFSQLGRNLFGDKPTATGNEYFDARFRITAADPVWAKALVTPPLVHAHLTAQLPEWSVVGAELLSYHHAAKIHDPNQIPAHAARLLHVANLLGRGIH
ncbi:hypothetical protein [Nocardia inohanensis]|uniref:hypothetical protein n=1 Tax=Nocardia inohanensis TaxID=209246 RepID=UPI00082D970F|nr:hypothetical protein [Nocardia inohanensis]